MKLVTCGLGQTLGQKCKFRHIMLLPATKGSQTVITQEGRGKKKEKKKKEKNTSDGTRTRNPRLAHGYSRSGVQEADALSIRPRRRMAKEVKFVVYITIFQISPRCTFVFYNTYPCILTLFSRIFWKKFIDCRHRKKGHNSYRLLFNPSSIVAASLNLQRARGIK